MTDVAAVSVRSPARRRGVWGWVAIGAVVLVVAIVGAAIASVAWSSKGLFDPDSAGPDGTRALVQILREHGVEVEVARTRADAADALSGAADTLVVTSTAPLSDDGLEDLMRDANTTVLVDPASRDIRVLFEGESAGVAPDAVTEPACDQPDAARAGGIVPSRIFTADEPVTRCYLVDGAYALLAREAEPAVFAIDAGALFTNEHLAENGNAALAIGLMGKHPTLVWYLPSPFDSDLPDTEPSIGDLTPPWVTPVLVLLAVAALAAGIWRGRRFGPLVAERLPVTVRAAETMEGRARLYERSRDSAHALDALRLGTLDRLAGLLGLGPNATAAEIADAAADRLAAPRGVVHDILIDRVPENDADLVAASDRLRDLEAAVRASVRIERNDP